MKWWHWILILIVLPITLIVGLYVWRKQANKPKTIQQVQAKSPQVGNAPQGATSTFGGAGQAGPSGSSTAQILTATAPIAVAGLGFLSQFVASGDDSEQDDGSEAS